jgi:hypothetical protein
MLEGLAINSMSKNIFQLESFDNYKMVQFLYFSKFYAQTVLHYFPFRIYLL